ncbi:serine/threonine protein kinase [Actinoplanes sp. TRM 88003]|uniref:Serine/threonine protein kinase n=1 Tax=Paractinoplanes aksuensis TaxID=2939490 RepID=A0ABT1E2Z5_9ACTN|nr:serine/threonine-protein kinase [Actinoplanes aksuensis]MCO8277499.1 serine/threonine protein kinase [Actinoplanes aksuensis]
MTGEEPLGREYLLREEIGRGASAIVRRAGRRSGGPDVAAKLLRPQFAGNRRVRDLLLREEAALRDLHHESIVGLRDLVVENSRIALLTELVDGPNLGGYLAGRGGALPAAEVSGIGAQVAAGLAAAHAQGVVHLDLKPENVLVAHGTDPVRVKISDFGVSALLFEANPAAAGGTPGYIAPEIARGGAATAAADVYALGVLLTELATGSRGRAAALPDGLRALVLSCLATDPRDRPSARSVAATLRSAGADATAQRPTPTGFPYGADPGGTWAGDTRLRSNAHPADAPLATVGSGRDHHRRRRRIAIGAGAGGLAVVAAVVTGIAVSAAAGEHNGAPAPGVTTTTPAAAVTGTTTAPGPVTPTELVATEARDTTRVTFAAHLPGGKGTLYLALRDGVATAYLCDGNRVEAWFSGTVSAGTFDLTGKKGGTLAGRFTDDEATGSVDAKGISTDFTIPRVYKPSGLYKAAGKVRNAEVKGGWIVLPDGSRVGVLSVGDQPQPAPSLEADGLTASVDGEALTVTEVDVDSGSGF